MPFYAHSIKGRPTDDWQPLASHLQAVARLAEQFAAEANSELPGFGRRARLAGLLHDLGKYRPEFQEMLLERRSKSEATRHKQAGAAAASALGSPEAVAAIAGHHGGLPDWSDLGELIIAPGGQNVYESVWDLAVRDCPDLNQLAGAPASPRTRDGLELDFRVRLLFSCLVDADWQDTGEFHDRAAGRGVEPSPPGLEPEVRIENVLAYIGERARTCPDPSVRQIRAEILQAVLKAAATSPGLFSMTVPTGGGKTLSALAFSLEHARRSNLRRVIYVAPYLSILEQNVREIRRALRVEATSPVVFEHHSLSEPRVHAEDFDAAQTSARLRRAENWDAPVVATTNVQFFESLFANQPGQCRKLHNIARSVVILDECQTLPPQFIAPARC
jgi:CRISPR-associated endonuclease/helicase Cas3